MFKISTLLTRCKWTSVSPARHLRLVMFKISTLLTSGKWTSVSHGLTSQRRNIAVILEYEAEHPSPDGILNQSARHNTAQGRGGSKAGGRAQYYSLTTKSTEFRLSVTNRAAL
ncbi:hypothetical protein J6590_036641 [Homalodisca vitripennis]|nr:hypothetical protein J6590_036641 [Homalodisca vitripennis]